MKIMYNYKYIVILCFIIKISVLVYFKLFCWYGKKITSGVNSLTYFLNYITTIHDEKLSKIQEPNVTTNVTEIHHLLNLKESILLQNMSLSVIFRNASAVSIFLSSLIKMLPFY